MQTAVDAAVLVTKLQSPRLHHRPLHRPRLNDALDTLSHCRLLLLCAPAGFGKTTLLSDWTMRAAATTDFAWLTLDDFDNDPERFWQHIAASVGLGRLTSDAVRFEGQGRITDALISSLTVGATEGKPHRRLFVVLDNYQLIRSPTVNNAVGFLIEHLPDDVTLVLSTRADPQLPLARLRVSGALTEFRAADLGFTLAETKAYLSDALPGPLPAHLVERVQARTDGWPAALHLAVMSARGRPNPIEYLESHFASDAFIVDYLAEEVLRSQPKRLQEFLLRTSILSTLNAQLCDAVTDGHDGALLLSQLQHWGTFLLPVDGSDTWFRYHPLLAQGLHTLLYRELAPMVPLLHAKASDWHACCGDYLNAITHAQLSGDSRRLADCIALVYRPLLLRGEIVTLMRVLESVPPDLTRSHPHLALAYAWSHIYSLQFNALERYLGAAEESLSSVSAAEAEQMRGEIMTMRAVYESIYGSAARAVQFARDAQSAAAPDDDLLQIVIHQALGNANRTEGEALTAIAEYRHVIAIGSRAGASVLVTLAQMRLAQLLAQCGQQDESFALLKRAAEQSAPQSGETSLFAPELLMTLGERHYERNELAPALALVKQAIALAQQTHHGLALVSSGLAVIQVLLAADTAEAARRFAEHMSEVALASQSPMLIELSALRRAWLDFKLGCPGLAQAWVVAQRAAGAQSLLVGAYQDEADLLRATMESLNGYHAEAMALVRGVIAHAQQGGRLRAVLQARIRLALVADASGDLALALAELQFALADAAQHGSVRDFLDQGGPMQRLLLALRAVLPLPGQHVQLSKTSMAYLNHLIALFAKSVTAAGRNGLPEQLTSRELEILRLLSKGANNSEIGRSLSISIGTVKAHTNRIFGKLNARNRTEAAAHARAFGLLDPAAPQVE